MRTPLLILMGLLVAAWGPMALAGGIPNPFGEPETAVSTTKKQTEPTARPGDDILTPAEIQANGHAGSSTIEREALAPLDAAPAAAVAAPSRAIPTGTQSPVPGPSAPPGWAASSRGGQDNGSGPSPMTEPVDGTRTVMRDELAPVMASDGSAVPYELWQGMTIETIEKSFSTIDIPPRSPALHKLLQRLILSDVPPPSGGGNPQFTAVRVEALDRMGLIDEAAAVLAKQMTADPVLSVLAARTAIARGDRDGGCRGIQAMNSGAASVPALLKGQSILVRAYCAVIAGNKESAQLQVALARDEGVEDSAGLAAIDALATGATPVFTNGQRVGPIDWRILDLAGTVDARALVEIAGPETLAIIARDTGTEPAARLTAAERAAQFNAITPGDLAQAYRTFAGGGATGDGSAAVQHAALFQSAEDEKTPLKKARLIRSFLDEARRSGFYWPALQAAAPAAALLPRVPEIGWFTQTAIETAVAAGDFAGARSWAQFGATLDTPDVGATSFVHWLALMDLVDPELTQGRAQHLPALENMAARGRFTPDQLHRLATVLDALQIQVPIPLWDLASRTPQPNTGYLPETGVLSALSQAAKNKEFGHTVLLVMQSLGPNGAEGAHIISLGDSIRALRSAGFDTDARKLALEALFMDWPRDTG